MGGCCIHRCGQWCYGHIVVVVYTLSLVVCGWLLGSSSWVAVACWWVVVLGAGCGCGWSLAFAAAGLWLLWPLVAICVCGHLLFVAVGGHR